MNENLVTIGVLAILIIAWGLLSSDPNGRACAGIGVFILAGALLWRGNIYLRDRRDEREELRKQQRAAEIMARGGPQSEEEYKFLFPDCCPTCGSRHFQDYTVDYHNNQCHWVYTQLTCDHCHRVTGDDIAELDLPASYGTTSYVVHSPFLTEEAAAGIPERFPEGH